MKNVVIFIAISIFSLVSCSNSDSNADPSTTNFTAVLNGANEVPANNSTAAGTATLTFNNSTKIFSITVNHNIASPTGGHIHMGAAGINGSVVFPFTTLTTPFTYTSAALTAAQESDLKANLYYVNIHTTAFNGGEIRGQLVKRATNGGGSGGGY
jgi:hypothetical protein